MTTIVYVEGSWHTGNHPLLGATTQATWLGAVVFDGARAFDGVAPDLDLHCARAVRSAKAMYMQPPVTGPEIEELAWEAIRRFPSGSALYIRPMFWIESGMVTFDPTSTRFALVVHDEAMPKADATFTACLSRFRRPSPEQAPTAAKASCLYPIASMAMHEARAKGFGNAVMLDPMGHVAEFTGSNIFLAKDGVVHTPIPNGTFLNGITRQRVIQLMRKAGTEVVERTVSVGDLEEADEIFSTGNFAKVMPMVGWEGRAIQPGPMARLARTLYWDYAFA
jgi:branched-chain amino acid aminotransferase